jgi:cytochrome P450
VRDGGSRAGADGAEEPAEQPRAAARQGPTRDLPTLGSAHRRRRQAALPTLDDVPGLVFTHHVLREAMRLYPPAYAFAREAVRDVEIGGYRIPKRSTVIVSQWVVHRDPRWWDQPETFDPDRWARDPLRRLPRLAYFPFGGGPHRCIGEQFAWTEAAVMKAMIVQRFALTHAAGHQVELEPLITIRPRHGMPMIVRDRATGAGAGPARARTA